MVSTQKALARAAGIRALCIMAFALPLMPIVRSLDAEEDGGLEMDEFANLPADVANIEDLANLEAPGDLEKLGLGGYEDGIGPGEDFGDYDDKYIRGLRDALREEEAREDKVSDEDIVRAGLDSDSPAAHMEGVLDLDHVTLPRVLAAAALTRWRLLLALYAPWDKACKEAGFVVRELGKRFGEDQSVLVAKADVDRYTKLAVLFNITTYTRTRTHTYPHFVLFQPGNSTGEHYSGELTAAALAGFALDIARAGVVEALEPLVHEFMRPQSRAGREGILAGVAAAVQPLPREQQEAAAYYVKVMQSVLDKGDGYVTKELGRISNVIQAGKMQEDKILGFRRRLNVLKVFALYLHDEL